MNGKKLLQKKCTASMAVEASYVIPLAMGVFLFCMGMFFFVYDRGVTYQNMLRQGVVTQMEMDEENAEHEIMPFPTMNLQSSQITMERGEKEIQVSSQAIQRNPLKNRSFMPTQRSFQSNAQQMLPVFQPMERLRNIRRALWLAGKAEKFLEP